MTRSTILAAALAASIFISGATVAAADPAGLATLKKAGIGDEVLQVVVAEKVLETGAFSVAELVDMKTAGIGDETLAAIVRSGSFSRMPDAIVYGVELEPLQFAGMDDLVRLKEAGVGDEVIRALVIVQSERADAVQRREAFELLQKMHIRVDERGGIAR